MTELVWSSETPSKKKEKGPKEVADDAEIPKRGTKRKSEALEQKNYPIEDRDKAKKPNKRFCPAHRRAHENAELRPQASEEETKAFVPKEPRGV